MTVWVALLRAVNVAGVNRLPMEEFRALLEDLGLKGARTYIQSGNAVFDGRASAGDIAAAIKKAVGFAPHVFLVAASALAVFGVILLLR